VERLVMSVVVLGHIDVEPAVMQKLMADRADDFLAVMHEAKEKGAIHHQFLADDRGAYFLDEWASAEQFQDFFINQATIRSLMEEAGVVSPPDIQIFEAVPSPDQF
jgi:hypothetical protein